MRALAVARRAALHRTGGAAAAQAVRRNFLAALGDGLALAPGEAVSGFWPMGDELDIKPLLADLHAMGCVCALPVVGTRAEPLSFRRWRPGDTLVRAGFGTHEPAPGAEPVTPALLLVPLLAFDDAGWRLGYGAGYYDRTLRSLRAQAPARAVGVAFEGQRIEAVPHTERDERLDWIVTEAGAQALRAAHPPGEEAR